jgi:hypothetical protein
MTQSQEAIAQPLFASEWISPYISTLKNPNYLLTTTIIVHLQTEIHSIKEFYHENYQIIDSQRIAAFSNSRMHKTS